ncbi:tRNA (guanosine(46)-N7)-methyltransferase TrmB [Bdellovibrionota bacterium FG-2]
MRFFEKADFIYPPAENIYSKRIEESGWSVYSDNAAEAHRGNWRDTFRDASKTTPARKLHVEIGCNRGHVILEWAAQSPQDAFIGIDWKFKVAYRGAEKANKRGLENLIFVRGRAERLQYTFGPGEIDNLYLFFPDPWQKMSQRKNRFVTSERLRQIAPFLKTGGIFHLKTDHAEYFEKMVLAAKECPEHWEIEEHTTDLHAGHPDPTSLKIPDVTLFERMFIKEGLQIKSLKLKRRVQM